MEVSSMVLRQVARVLIPASSETTAQTSYADKTTKIWVRRRFVRDCILWENTIGAVLVDWCWWRISPQHVVFFFPSDGTIVLLVLFLRLLLLRGRSRDYFGRNGRSHMLGDSAPCGSAFSSPVLVIFPRIKYNGCPSGGQ